MTDMRITLIAAIAANGAIGAQGDLPWHLPADLDFFYRQIAGCLLLSGRRSYDSPQGRAMFTPERRVIVVSRQPDFQAPPHVMVAVSVEDAVQQARHSGAPRLCVLGGAEIYLQTIGIADELVITQVHAAFPDADSFFPDIDPAVWKEVWREDHMADEENGYGYSFVRYERWVDGVMC